MNNDEILTYNTEQNKDKQYNPSIDNKIIKEDNLSYFMTNAAIVKKQLLQMILDYYGETEYPDDYSIEDEIKDNEQLIYRNNEFEEYFGDEGLINLNVPISWNVIKKKSNSFVESIPRDGYFGGIIGLPLNLDITPIDNWDRQASIEYLIKNAESTSVHLCATYVKRALVAGGFPYIPGHAQQCHENGILASMGFTWIDTVDSNNRFAWTQSNAQPGDIAVYRKPPASSSQYGHICMYTGEQWISDFKQNSFWVYSNPGVAWIYRYIGEDTT